MVHAGLANALTARCMMGSKLGRFECDLLELTTLTVSANKNVWERSPEIKV
jgi:hypothetical protein